ncbi:MAG: retroviral-like aspartic protease family protein [Stenomitos rutilans HA7619-LM2]|jgi:predicted aspartyl protease|nr:retroviral-like aspartic protease family protein [Stenomitos rutilans HA7619-LM2]
MLKRPCFNVLLLILSGAVFLGSTACSRNTSVKTAVTSPETPPVTVSSPAVTSLRPVPPPVAAANQDAYKLALEKADSASNITISAQSRDDWNLVVSRWQQAIQSMRSVPNSSPYRSLAKAKLAEYQRNLAYARKQATRADSSEIASEPALLPIVPRTDTASTSNPEIVSSNASSRSGRVYIARIKRRAGGTPVIDVTFNGNRTFEMIVDTGASGTVITSAMASNLGVKVVGKAKVDTASDKSVEVPLAYVNSIAVGGAVIKGVVVAIGNSALDTGLLGHDFFSDYDVTIKRNVVEFKQR